MESRDLLAFLDNVCEHLATTGDSVSYGHAKICITSVLGRRLEVGVGETVYWLRTEVAFALPAGVSIWYAPVGSYYRAKVTEAPDLEWCDLRATYVVMGTNPTVRAEALPPSAVELLLQFSDLRPKIGLPVPPWRGSANLKPFAVESSPALWASERNAPAHFGEFPFTSQECASNAKRLITLATGLENCAETA